MYSLEALRSAESGVAAPHAVTVSSPARATLPQSTSQLFSSILDATRRAGRLTGETTPRVEQRPERPAREEAQASEKSVPAAETREPARTQRSDARTQRSEARRSTREAKDTEPRGTVESAAQETSAPRDAQDVQPEPTPEPEPKPEPQLEPEAEPVVGDETPATREPQTAVPPVMMGLLVAASDTLSRVIPGLNPAAVNSPVVSSPVAGDMTLPAGAQPQADAPNAGGSAGGSTPLPPGLVPTGAVPAALRPADGESGASSSPHSEQNTTPAKGTSSNTTFAHALHAARAGSARGVSAGAHAMPTADTVRLDEPGSIRELAQVVRTTSRNGHSNMLLRLDPPELGTLRLDVRMQHDMLTLRIEAHSQAGHDALQGRLAELRTALEQQGIQVAAIDIELKPPAASHGSGSSDTPTGDHHAGDGASGHSQGSAHDAREGSPERSFTWRGPDVPETAEPTPAIVGSIGMTSAALDLVA